MGTKTQAIGIIGLDYHGGLLERFVSPKPLLPGTTIMMPEDCHGVLVAGENATKTFKVGPHELDLMDFNRQPSGLIYLVASNPITQMGTTREGNVERHLEIQVEDAQAFVQHFVIEDSQEEDHEIWKSLFLLVDAALLQTEKPPIRKTLHELLGVQLKNWGIRITDFFEQPSMNSLAEKKTLRIRKSPFYDSSKEKKTQ